MGTTLITRRVALLLTDESTLRRLRNGQITEHLLQTGATLVTRQQGAVLRYAIYGYAADGSDRDLTRLLGTNN